MTLYDVYTKLHHGKITHEEAAEQYGITVRELKFKLTRHGGRLPRILKTLDRIRDDEVSRDEAAHILGVTVRQVNNLMNSWKAPRPLKQYLIDNAITAVKWEIRKRYAIEYIAGTCTLLEASENAEVSDRQMRRWIRDLLMEHQQMEFRDLKKVRESQRKRIADEIEEAENLSYEKINVLKEVASGAKAIKDVALERVMAKRTNRRLPTNVQSKPTS